MRYSWVIFDADGTLFDYKKAEANALKRAFLTAGFPFSSEVLQNYQRINAFYWQQYEAGTIEQKDLRWKRFHDLLDECGFLFSASKMSEAYLGYLSEGTDLLDGAIELIHDLKDEVGLVLMTNGIGSVQRPRLTASQLGGCFQHVIISSEVGAAKPAPIIFQTALTQMGSPPLSDILMVGDSLASDIKGAHDFGIDTCWFNPQELAWDSSVQPTYVIQCLKQLLPILDSK